MKNKSYFDNHRIQYCMLYLILCLCHTIVYSQTLDETCTATILNRTVQVQEGGFVSIPNIPVEQGVFRVRFTCDDNGTTVSAHSDFLELQPNTATNIGPITFGNVDPTR